MQLAGKTVLITGGGSGLGAAIVESLSNLGTRVVVLDKDESALEELCRSNNRITGKFCDVTSVEEVEKTVRESWQECGGIQALVNNAGILYSAPLIGIKAEGLNRHDPAAWDKVINTNLNAVFYVTANLVSHMVKSRTRGVIINMSSISASGNAGQSAYSAAKAGVEALTVSWARELGPWGIRVAALAPGFMETPSTREATPESSLQHIQKEIPLKRFGRTEEVVQAVKFIFENDYINGTTLQLDGGLRL